MIGETVSRYKILRKLGEGGMGEVYLAEDTELERRVALKFLPPHYATDVDALSRFKREAQAAAALDHPNIITVYEVGQHESQFFIAMAYVEGDLLGDLIDKRDVRIEGAVDIAIQICDGLGAAHQAGITHRDVKPGNILLDRDGRVKILDFGLATREGLPKLTQHDSTVGTISYMSPEQARGEEVDHRSDIFSLGAVLYELIAGQSPFKGDHSAAVLYSIANEEPQPLARFNNRVTSELERIVGKALAKRPEDRYQSTADLAVDLKHALRIRSPAESKMKLLRFAIPTSVVFAAVILMLVLKPFRVEISPDHTAVASDNRLAIMYFENMVNHEDPQRLGEIVTDLLITNLSRSEDLQVVSSQRLYDILKRRGKEGAKVIDRTTATEVARDAGAKWMMLGRILQVEPSFVVTSQLIDMGTGNVVNSQRVTGAAGESIFSIVDRMTGDTKGELHIPVKKGIEEGISVADVTTNSLEAYRYYLEGEELRNKVYSIEARESYRKAIAQDSTFAMAYLKLALAGAFSSFEESRAAIAKAVEYSDKVSGKEKLYIQGIRGWFSADHGQILSSFERIVREYPDEKDAYRLLALYYRERTQFDKAIEYEQKIVDIDPLDKLVYNSLAYAYNEVGDFDKSIWAINKYIELAPEEPNPYDTRGDLYAYNGRVDAAIASYEKAAAIKRDFTASVAKLGHMYLYQLDEGRAATQYRKLVAGEQPSARSLGRGWLANIPLYRGDFAEGLKQMDLAISADEMEGFREFAYVQKFFLKAAAYGLLGDYDQALLEGERGAKAMRALLGESVPSFNQVIDLVRATFFAWNKRLPEAIEIMEVVEPVVKGSSNNDVMQQYYSAKGVIALESGDAETACGYFEKAAEISSDFGVRYLLATGYLQANRLEEAIALFEKILRRYDSERISSTPWSVLAQYYLGLAYDKSGEQEKAATQYDRFLTIWENADARIEQVSEAKARLARLRTSG